MCPGDLNIHGSVGKVEQADIIHNHGNQVFSVGLSADSLIQLARDVRAGIALLPVDHMSASERARLEQLTHEVESLVEKKDRSAAAHRGDAIIATLKSTFEAVDVIGRAFLLCAGLGPR